MANQSRNVRVDPEREIILTIKEHKYLLDTINILREDARDLHKLISIQNNQINNLARLVENK